MNLNNTTRDALNWCLLLETGMTKDINNMFAKGKDSKLNIFV